MREIKFRAWDKIKNFMWYEGFELNFKGQITKTYGIYTAPFHLELMQFTGLHDKNGKEIWEGDIIETCDKEIGVIVFHDAEFVIDFETPGGEGWDSIRKIICKVIGNIYENPELMEGI